MCNCVYILLLNSVHVHFLFNHAFLRAKAGTAIARLSHRNSALSVCPSVFPSVTRVDQSKTVQARMIKSLLSAAR